MNEADRTLALRSPAIGEALVGLFTGYVLSVASRLLDASGMFGSTPGQHDEMRVGREGRALGEGRHHPGERANVRRWLWEAL